MTTAHFRPPQRDIWRRLGWMAAGLAGIGALWLGGLFWFASLVPREAATDLNPTDAIVVLTGGTGRLDEGLRLLAAGKAKRLFVSGVARGVDVAVLLRLARREPEELGRRISVGYRADNTAGNARETAEWMHRNGFRSLRLVTASYHMPRSLVEFHRAMPDIAITPHPVFPPQFKRNAWWTWPGSAMLLASEFNKYIIARTMLSSARPQPEESAS